MGCTASAEPVRHGQGGAYPKQQYQQPNGQMPAADKIEVEKVELTREVLDRYIILEKEIHALETKNVMKNLETKKDDHKDYESQFASLEQKYNEALKKTAKEKADVDELNMPSVKQFFEQQGNFDEKFSKEQEEYLQAMNEQEIIQRERDSVAALRDQCVNEINLLQTDADKLNSLYKEQDGLLAGIFNGEYGSDLEDRLESQLDSLLERKQRIGVAKYKWTNSRVLMQYACNQLTLAVKQWEQVLHIQQIPQRYAIATEVRNNLVAANQNITSAQRYLNNITFPYCKPEEMGTLNKATNNIYTDMQVADRHGHALQCFSVTHRRALALLQWFDMVIAQTITKDLDSAVALCKKKEKQLRAERLRCIREKIREANGENITITDEDSYQEMMDLQEEKEPVPDVRQVEAATVGESEAEKEEERKNSVVVAAVPGPMSEEDLAPAPAGLFGNIDALKEQHEKEIEEFNKAQDLNKARMEQGLEEKLQARRSRRKRAEGAE